MSVEYSGVLCPYCDKVSSFTDADTAQGNHICPNCHSVVRTARRLRSELIQRWPDLEWHIVGKRQVVGESPQVNIWVAAMQDDSRVLMDVQIKPGHNEILVWSRVHETLADAISAAQDSLHHLANSLRALLPE